MPAGQVRGYSLEHSSATEATTATAETAAATATTTATAAESTRRRARHTTRATEATTTATGILTTERIEAIDYMEHYITVDAVVPRLGTSECILAEREAALIVENIIELQ